MGSSCTSHTSLNPAWPHRPPYSMSFIPTCSLAFKALLPDPPPASLSQKQPLFLEIFFQRVGSRYWAELPCLTLSSWPRPLWALTSLPSVSKKSNCREMRYWVGATNCQMQFLLGGYSLGQPGLVMEPLSLVRNPPQAAGGRGRRHHPPGGLLQGGAGYVGWCIMGGKGICGPLQPWG